LNPALARCKDRWYPLNNIPIYADLLGAVPSGIRFPLVPAGRRSGKTEKFKRFLSTEAMSKPGEKYFAGAPTRDQAKKIFWNDLKLLTFSPSFPKRPSESELIIFMPNGSEIHVIGLDRPERIEGTNWTGGGIDEVADLKESAIMENIMPALDTVDPRRPDYRAWCWFFGVPDGLNHYYDMCEAAQSGITKDAKVFHWKSSEVLPAEIIAAAKARMSARQFRQEYEASFETATGRIYEDYGKDNYTDAVIEPHEQLMWMHDQNFTPLSSAVGVRRNDQLFLMDEIVMTSAISRQSAIEFVEKFKDHQNKHVLIYGDPAGRAGEKHGHPSDYTEIESVLRNSGWEYTRKVQMSHPAIKDRQNAVRARICNALGERNLFVNPKTAPWCHKGLATVQTKDGSAFQEDQKNDYQHITTAIGYCVETEWPIGGKVTSATFRF
jgi:hypothetical protein